MNTPAIDLLLAQPDEPTRQAWLTAHAPSLSAAETTALADALKAQADHYLRAELAASFQFVRLLFHLAQVRQSQLVHALALRAEGNALSIGQGEYHKALACYNHAADIYTQHHLPIDAARAQIGKVTVLAFIGQYAEALNCGAFIAEVFAENELWDELGTVSLNLGMVHGRLNKNHESLDDFGRAIFAYEKANSTKSYLVLLSRALVFQNLGLFKESIRDSETAWRGFYKHNQTTEAAKAQHNLAITYFVLGQYQNAIATLEQATAIYRADQRWRDVSEAELFMGECFAQLRRFDEAVAKCRAARQHFEKLGAQFEVALAQFYEALALAQTGTSPAALHAFQAARTLFAHEGNAVWMTHTDLEIATVLLQQGDAQAALHGALACAALYAARELPVKQAQAQLLAARCSPAHALALANAALETAQNKRVLGLLHQAFLVRGCIYQNQNKPDEALADFDAAIAALEDMRGQLMTEFRASFLQDKNEAYEHAVALCLANNQPAVALDYAERAKSRALIDLLANRVTLGVSPRHATDQPLVDELQQLRQQHAQRVRMRRAHALDTAENQPAAPTPNLTSDADIHQLEQTITERWHTLLLRNADYARDAALWQTKTEPVQPYLAQDEAVVEYFGVGADWVAFVATAQHIRAFRLPRAQAETQNWLRKWWLNVRALPSTPPARLPQLARHAQHILQGLFSVLMAPFAPALADIKHIRVVPHGDLHYIPFHALHNGTHALIEHYEISYLPSASLLKWVQPAHRAEKQMPIHQHEPARRASRFSTGVYARAAADGFSGVAFGYTHNGVLPQAAQEAAQVAELLGGTAFTESAATLAQLREQAAQANVLHLAAHADFRADNPLFCGVQLADGMLTTLDVFGLQLHAELVTLSACQTGRSVVSGGDELLGLTRAFLAAGAKSLLLSLWRVEDDSTQRWMRQFYTALQAGSPKRAAFRAACLEGIRAGHSPYFWAPFVLVGAG